MEADSSVEDDVCNADTLFKPGLVQRTLGCRLEAMTAMIIAFARDRSLDIAFIDIPIVDVYGAFVDSDQFSDLFLTQIHAESQFLEPYREFCYHSSYHLSAHTYNIAKNGFQLGDLSCHIANLHAVRL